MLAPCMMAMDTSTTRSHSTPSSKKSTWSSNFTRRRHTDLFSRYFEEVFGTQDTATYRVGGY